MPYSFYPIEAFLRNSSKPITKQDYATKSMHRDSESDRIGHEIRAENSNRRRSSREPEFLFAGALNSVEELPPHVE